MVQKTKLNRIYLKLTTLIISMYLMLERQYKYFTIQRYTYTQACIDFARVFVPQLAKIASRLWKYVYIFLSWYQGINIYKVHSDVPTRFFSTNTAITFFSQVLSFSFGFVRNNFDRTWIKYLQGNPQINIVIALHIVTKIMYHTW